MNPHVTAHERFLAAQRQRLSQTLHLPIDVVETAADRRARRESGWFITSLGAGHGASPGVKSCLGPPPTESKAALSAEDN